MTQVHEDWRALPLGGDGRGLIEASAGSGKTWTIAALYLRLLLEGDGLSPRRIIVATFSNAAAAELRERLRGRLQQAEDAARGDLVVTGRDDAVLAWLDARWQGDALQRSEDLRRLRIGLAELDLAPIGTLHSLCARILREHPFAAGGRLEPTEVVDASTLAQELAQDLARVLGQSDAAALDAWLPPELRAQLAGAVPDAKELGTLLKPLLRIEPGERPAWPGDNVIATLRAGARDGLFRANSRIPKAWQAAADALESRDLTLIDKDQRALLALPKGLAGLLKANENAPAVLAAEQASIALAGTLQALFEHRERALWQRLRDWAVERKQAWMQRHDRIGFDDLLARVHVALDDERSRDARPLADALFTAWPVALIDEFQDTDGLQFGILDTIYRDACGHPRGRLLMIGDPKQAIYRFRGGDIHAYRRAAADAGDHLPLAVNHRSSSAYVEAINAFFEAAGPALDAADHDHAASGIHYLPVQAAGRADAHPYAIDGDSVARPLVVHLRGDASDNKGRQVDDALDACASQIAEMLSSGRHAIGGEPLRPEHIAVLLPDNHQIARLRVRLERKGVPCVTQSRDSVFAGETARDLQVVLHAVLHAESMPHVRAALATRLGGLTLDQLAALDTDPVEWQRQNQRFHAWRGIWRTRGVPALVDALIAVHGPRLLAEDDGERLLTDLRHLAELLQAQADAVMGEGELLAWFAAQRSDSGGGNDDEREARQVRIESQSPRVRLLTLHASKGLEFPIVFLPLMSMHEGRNESDLLALHDEDGDGLCLRLDAAARTQDQREAQDERFRVLYVALTRAIHACHVFAVPEPGEGVKSARRRPSGAARSALDIMLARMSPEARTATEARIEWREGWANPAEAELRLPRHDRATRQARIMPPAPALPLPSRQSFSALTRGLSAADGSVEAPAADETDQADAEAEASASGGSEADAALQALADARGPELGNALHDALEARELGTPMALQLPLLAEKFKARNVAREKATDNAWLAAWAVRLDGALDAPLGRELPSLAALPADAQRAEMEFHFSLGATSMQRLRQACVAHGEHELVPVSDRRMAGLMTGKIDLIFRHEDRFHVLDYKGNFLGTRLDDYRPAALAREMDRHHYRFQALIYVVALDRHLRLRLPGYERSRHLGDACYLFLRAAGLAPDLGIWRHRFRDELIDAIDTALPAMSMESEA